MLDAPTNSEKQISQKWLEYEIWYYLGTLQAGDYIVKTLSLKKHMIPEGKDDAITTSSYIFTSSSGKNFVQWAVADPEFKLLRG